MSNVKKSLKPVNTPVYQYREAVYRSFYSKNLYVDVGKRWHGLGLRYLLLIIAIFCIPLALKLTITLSQVLDDQIMEPLRKLPVLYIQNGKLSFDKPMPYLITNKEGQVVLIVDTTGKVNQFDSTYPDLNILFNKDKVTYRIPSPDLFNTDQILHNQGVPTVQLFDNRVNLVFDGKKIVSDRSILILKYMAQILIYPILVAALFSMFVIFFPVIALMGQVFSRVFFSFKIPYSCASRLLIVSSTPMLFVLNLLLVSKFIFMGMGILLFALLLIYYSFALFSLKLESRRVALK